jgi:hypothetical protein
LPRPLSGFGWFRWGASIEGWQSNMFLDWCA